MERLDKRLSAAGYSRKEAAALVRAGRVTVDGAAAKDPGGKYPETAAVQVDGAPLGSGRCWLMLHKPAGVVCATEDPSQSTVIDLLPEAYRRRGLFPVGRLDKDTTGLVLLTNDGPAAHCLTAPRRHVDKVYKVTVAGELTAADRTALAAGLTLGDGLHCLPARLELAPEAPNVGYLTLHEGKFHQVKRMMACLGKPVTALARVAMGPLGLDESLAPGQWRELTAEELEKLFQQIAQKN